MLLIRSSWSVCGVLRKTSYAIVLTVALVAPVRAGQRTPPQTPKPRRPPPSQAAAKKQFVFRGTVEKVNTAGGMLEVKNDNIPGWMGPMSMAYHVDDPAVLKTIKAGDSITATVYEGDTSKLYKVRVVAPPKKSAASALPPISYVCNSSGEESYLDDKPGRCPKSGAALQPVRLDIAYKCLRTAYIEDKPGVCPVDHTDLVPVTASVFWVCSNQSERHLLDPGMCSDGNPREKKFEVRPHGDHNPRHGGPAVFMSEDLYHHVEATLVAPTKVQPAIFRVYFYDEYTRPIKAAGVSAQVTRADANSTATGPAVGLEPSRNRDGNAMQTALSGAPVPSKDAPAFFKLRVRFKPTDKDWVTDYQFSAYSKEPPALPSAVTNQVVAAQPTPDAQKAAAASRAYAPAVPAAAGTPIADIAQMVNPALLNVQIPGTLKEIVAEIDVRNRTISELVDAGRFTDIWLPAFEAKELALAIIGYGPGMPTYKRRGLDPAVDRLVRAAWMLDAFGDLGNREHIVAAYADFASSVAAIGTLAGGGTQQ
jgi:Cu/Ag efflux protein CusF